MSEQDLLENMQYLGNDAVKTDNISVTDELHVAICGDSGSGKTNLIARTCRKPLLDFDFDDRKQSIAGLPDIVALTLVDVYDDQPKAWADFESHIGSLENLKRQGKLAFKSIALSSMTYLRKYAEHQFLKDTSGITAKKFRVGSTNYAIPKDWDAVTGVQHMLETMINRLFALDIDIYVEFHLRNEKDKNKSTKTDIVYKENFTVEPENLKMLLPKFNDTWRTFVDTDGNFKMQVRPDWMFGAKNTLKSEIDVVPQDIQALINEYNSKKGRP